MTQNTQADSNEVAPLQNNQQGQQSASSQQIGNPPMQNESSGNEQQSGNDVRESLNEIYNEIKKMGEETENSSRTNKNSQEQSVSSEQSPRNNMSSESRGVSEQRGYETSDSNSQTFDDHSFEIEREIVRQIQIIKMNADKYGPVTDVVGRRAVLVKSTTGRGNGYSFEYLLADGRIVSNEKAWELANAGKLKDIIGSHNRGRKYIRRVGDGIRDNNLGNLPTF